MATSDDDSKPEGTVHGVPEEKFNPEADAEYIKQCMDGWGTEDTKLMTIITDRTNKQRVKIAEVYNAEYGDLVGRIQSETSGKYEQTLVALMTESAKFDAQQVRDAVEGFGTNERLLNEIICTRTGQELAKIRDAYEEKYHESLIVRVAREAGGDYGKYLVACLEKRPLEGDDNEDGSDQAVNEAVEQLYNAGEARWGTDEDVFVNVLAGSSFARLKKIAEAYGTRSDKSLLQACIKELHGHFEDAVVITIMQAMSPVQLWGEKIHASMKGLGTDDSRLIQLMVSRSERDLLNIRNRFGMDIGEGTSLGGWIQHDTSGQFQSVLLSILHADREPILVGVDDGEDDDDKQDDDPEEFEPEPMEDDQPDDGTLPVEWLAMECTGIYVTVGAAHQQYFLDETGYVFARPADGEWVQIPGSLSMISCGGPNSSVVVGCNKNGEIYKLNGADCDNPAGVYSDNPWTTIGGELKFVSVGATGCLWGVNSVDDIYFSASADAVEWVKVPGKLMQVSADPVTNQVIGVNSEFRIWWRTGVTFENPMGDNWKEMENSLKYVSTFGNMVMGTNVEDQIYAMAPGSTEWVLVKGELTHVNLGPNGTAVGTNADNIMLWGNVQM